MEYVPTAALYGKAQCTERLVSAESHFGCENTNCVSKQHLPYEVSKTPNSIQQSFFHVSDKSPPPDQEAQCHWHSQFTFILQHIFQRRLFFLNQITWLMHSIKTHKIVMRGVKTRTIRGNTKRRKSKYHKHFLVINKYHQLRHICFVWGVKSNNEDTLFGICYLTQRF